MSTFVARAAYPISVENRGQLQLVRQAFAALVYRTRAAIRAVSEKLERGFATFAGVPYHDPLDMEEWEQLWDTRY